MSANANRHSSPFRIAVPTNDGMNIFPIMLGMAKEILIVETQDMIHWQKIETRENPFEHTQQHQKTLDVYEIIRDCQGVVAAHIGKKGIQRLEDRSMRVYLHSGTVEEAIEGALTVWRGMVS